MKPARLVLAAATVLCLGMGQPAGAQTNAFDRFMGLVTGRLGRPTGPTQVRWLPNGQGYLQAEPDSASGLTRYWKVDPATGAKSPLWDKIRAEKLRKALAGIAPASAPADAYPFGDFAYERGDRAIAFERSGARYLYDLETGELRRLALPTKVGPLNLGTTEGGKFSPDYNWYAFIRDYDNLWICDTRTGQETRLTTGTSEDNLIGFLNAGEWYAWSPDGRRIAYLKANQQGLYPYPQLDDLDRHATVEKFRYPFTTDPNPPVEIHLIDVASKADVTVETGTIEKPFLRELAWLPDGSALTYQIVNQWESRLELEAVDTLGRGKRTLLVDSDSAYLDELHNFKVLAGGRFLWSSQRTGWRHLYLYGREGGEPRPITTGEWETGQVLGVDEKGGFVYLEGATALGLERHLFRVRLDGTGLTQLTKEPGVHRLSMDPAARFLLDRHSAIDRPPVVVLRSADGRMLRQLAATDVAPIAAMHLRAPEILSLETTDGQPMHGILYRPADFDSTKKYPLVVSVYGGPHTKAVRNAYQTIDFDNALAQLGFLVAEFDARGTLDHGKRFQTANYMRLGQVDVDDQAAGVRQLAKRPYVDASRVGVTGISHGGYMTLMMILRYPDVYQVAVAGAPMTDVRNGPRQYIGRFMRTPDANPEGYAKADVLPLAKNLKGRLLVVHGTGDKNAVLTNTMQLLRKFVELGKPVDVMIYPKGVHVLEGADGLHNLRNTIGYFLEHLRPEGWADNWARIWGQNP